MPDRHSKAYRPLRAHPSLQRSGKADRDAYLVEHAELSVRVVDLRKRAEDIPYAFPKGSSGFKLASTSAPLHPLWA